jgi:hypothetical protein
MSVAKFEQMARDEAETKPNRAGSPSRGRAALLMGLAAATGRRRLSLLRA